MSKGNNEISSAASKTYFSYYFNNCSEIIELIRSSSYVSIFKLSVIKNFCAVVGYFLEEKKYRKLLKI